MSDRNLLVLLVGDASPSELRHAVAARVSQQAHVHVVAPPVIRALDWLASADDPARRAAEVRALEAEWILADEADVTGETPDNDPYHAVEDTLRCFPADAILLAGEAADTDLERSLRGFALPVSRSGPLPPHHRLPSRLAHRLADGRGWATPFALFVAVNTVMLLAGIVLSAVALLALWLLGAT